MKKYKTEAFSFPVVKAEQKREIHEPVMGTRSSKKVQKEKHP